MSLFFVLGLDANDFILVMQPPEWTRKNKDFILCSSALSREVRVFFVNIPISVRSTILKNYEVPTGVSAQIQGHKPQGVREQHYIRRPLDLLRMWHVKIEAWILGQAGIVFLPGQTGLRVVKITTAKDFGGEEPVRIFV